MTAHRKRWRRNRRPSLSKPREKHRHQRPLSESSRQIAPSSSTAVLPDPPPLRVKVKKAAANRRRNGSRSCAGIGAKATVRLVTSSARTSITLSLFRYLPFLLSSLIRHPPVHDVPNHLYPLPYTQLPPNAGPPPPPKRRRPAPPPAPHNPFARPAGFSDPFSLVEERDHRHIVADVLQVIEFLGANDWLQGVEIRRGQVDEESGIQVLGETTQDEAVSGERKEEEPSKQPAGIVELSEGSDKEVPPQSSAVDLSSDAPRETTAPTLLAPDSNATASAPAPSKSSTTGAGVGLFADYGSDSDDEAEVEQAVALALLASAP